MKLMQQCESREFLALTFYGRPSSATYVTIRECSMPRLLAFASKACVERGYWPKFTGKLEQNLSLALLRVEALDSNFLVWRSEIASS